MYYKRIGMPQTNIIFIKKRRRKRSWLTIFENYSDICLDSISVEKKWNSMKYTFKIFLPLLAVNAIMADKSSVDMGTVIGIDLGTTYSW